MLSLSREGDGAGIMPLRYLPLHISQFSSQKYPVMLIDLNFLLG
jgi:hypothetical protein